MEQEVLLHKWIWGQSRKEADNFFSQGTRSRIILSSDVKKTDGMNIMKLNVDFDRGEFYIFEIFLFILFVWNGQWNETSHIPFLHNVTFLAGLEVITICTHSNIPMRIISLIRILLWFLVYQNTARFSTYRPPPSVFSSRAWHLNLSW